MFKLLPRYDQAGDANSATAAVSSADTTGQNAINSYDPTAAGNTSSSAVNSNFGTQQGENAQAVNPLQSVVSSNPTVQSLYQTGNQLYNVPALANQSARLQNEVTNTVPDAYAGAKGFDIDNADVQNGIAQKSAYLLPQSNAATNNFNTASGLASNYVNAGIQQNLQNLIPAQENATLTGQNMQGQTAGLNQAQQFTLQGLIDKMNAGVTLSSNDMTTMANLFASEEAYNANAVTANAGIQEAQLKNEFQTLSPFETLYNTTNDQKYSPAGAGNLQNYLASTFGA